MLMQMLLCLSFWWTCFSSVILCWLIASEWVHHSVFRNRIHCFITMKFFAKWLWVTKSLVDWFFLLLIFCCHLGVAHYNNQMQPSIHRCACDFQATNLSFLIKKMSVIILFLLLCRFRLHCYYYSLSSHCYFVMMCLFLWCERDKIFIIFGGN